MFSSFMPLQSQPTFREITETIRTQRQDFMAMVAKAWVKRKYIEITKRRLESLLKVDLDKVKQVNLSKKRR